MSTDDNIRFTAIDGKLAGLASDNARMTTDVSAIKSDLSQVRGTVDGISGGVTTMKWIFALAVAYTIFFGESAMKEAARAVYREEMGYRTVVQDGKFTNQNLLSAASQNATSVQFLWKLKTPIDPKKLITMRAFSNELPQSVKLSAALNEDGLSCTMTLTGPRDAMESLPLPINATVIAEAKL